MTIFCHFFKELLSTQNVNVENVRLLGAIFKHCGIYICQENGFIHVTRRQIEGDAALDVLAEFEVSVKSHGHI